MKLLVNTLPSQGYCKSKRDFIEINPLTYRQLKKYTSAKYTTEIEKLVWDIECLIQDIIGWEDLSMYDLTSLLFTRRLLSATFEPELKLTFGDNVYTINIQDISFKDMPVELKTLDTVEINGKKFKFRLPSLYEYYKVLKYASGDVENLNDFSLEIVTFASTLVPISSSEDQSWENMDSLDAYKQAIKSVDTSVQQDIVVIETIQTLLQDKLNDVTVKGEGGETAVSLNGLTADIFRLIWLNAGNISDRISFKEGLQP